MRKRVLVAMSGGVDSAVAAYLLKQAGYEVSGATIRTWSPGDCADRNTRSCCGISGVEDARRAARTIGIPYYLFNFEREFGAQVVDYFKDEYAKGRTPNPCIKCNEHVKIRLFLKRALALGFDCIATGHYARIEQVGANGSMRFLLTEGADAWKDQSYVLFPLQQAELARLLLPIGGLRKPAVRRTAQAAGLALHDKPDSQEICFIPSNDYVTFLSHNFQMTGQPGHILSTTGERLGTHAGYFHYTVGQRKRLGIAAPHPLYVTEIRPGSNEVVVGTKAEVGERALVVDRLNWLIPPPTRGVLECQVKIRAHHEKAPARIECSGNGWVRVEFREPQEAITPGQAAVFYQAHRVIGGGWIRGKTA